MMELTFVQLAGPMKVDFVPDIPREDDDKKKKAAEADTGPKDLVLPGKFSPRGFLS